MSYSLAPVNVLHLMVQVNPDGNKFHDRSRETVLNFLGRLRIVRRSLNQ